MAFIILTLTCGLTSTCTWNYTPSILDSWVKEDKVIMLRCYTAEIQAASNIYII